MEHTAKKRTTMIEKSHHCCEGRRAGGREPRGKSDSNSEKEKENRMGDRTVSVCKSSFLKLHLSKNGDCPFPK